MIIRRAKSNGKPCWCLDARDIKLGRRFFEKKSEAETELATLETQRKVNGEAWTLMTAGQRLEVLSVLGEIEKANHTLREVWESFKANKHRSTTKTCTLKNALDELLVAKQVANCRPRHIGNLEWYLGRFIKGRESKDVSTIGEPELNEWFAGSKDAPRSRRGYMALLSTFFTHCWRRGYVAENPVKRMQPIHIDREVPKVLTLDQCEKALKFVQEKKPNLLAWLILTLFVGLRPESEADFTEWSDIDLKKNRIVLNKTKTRRHRIIDLSFCPPAIAWLNTAEKVECPLPLANVTRRRYLRALRGHLGLERWPQDILRHTAASNLLAHHQDAGKVAEFLGNSAGTLIRDYKALIFKEDAGKFFKLLPKKRHFKSEKKPVPCPRS